MTGNFHVQFCGEGVAVTSPPYPAQGGAIPQGDPALPVCQSALSHPEETGRRGHVKCSLAFHPTCSPARRRTAN